MMIGKTCGLGGDSVETGSIETTLKVAAERREALQYPRLFEQVLDPQRAGMAELESKALVGWGVERSFGGEAVETFVHNRPWSDVQVEGTYM